MLFFGVFLRESARTAAKSRTKFKSLGKLSNGWTDWHKIWYKSADSSGNGHRLNTIRPSIPQGAFRRGVTNSSLGKLPNGWTDWHQIWYTSVDMSGNGHRLKPIRHTIHQGGIFFFRGSTMQKTGKCGQMAGPIGNKFCTYNADESRYGHMLNAP